MVCHMGKIPHTPEEMRTLIAVLIYGCVACAPIGMLVAFISILYGRLTGRLPSTFVDDVRINDIVCLIGMLLTVIGVALGFVGLVLAFVFVTPTLSQLLKFIASLFRS